MTIVIPNNATATIKLKILDASGQPIAPPAGGNVTSSNPTYIAATLESDGLTVALVPAVGAYNVSATVSYTNTTNPALTASDTVNVVQPVASSVTFDETSLAFVPR